MSRTVTWIVFSSAGILFMPVMIETERLQIQDQQKAQKNQMLFGTGIEKVLKKTDGQMFMSWFVHQISFYTYRV